MLNKLRSIFSKKKKSLDNDELVAEVINKPFEFAGHTFKFINPMSDEFLLKNRNDFFLMEYERNWGILKADILKFLNVAVHTCEHPVSKDIGEQVKQLSDKLADVKTLISQLYLVIKEDYQFKPFMKSAAVVILVDDEKPEDPIGKYLDLKMELCMKHPEIEGFFLSVIRSLHYRLQNKSDIIKMLESSPQKERGQRALERTLYEMVQLSPYPTGEASETKTSTPTQHS